MLVGVRSSSSENLRKPMEYANLEPLPYSEVTLMEPPISVTSCLQMVRPRPEPAGLETRVSEI